MTKQTPNLILGSSSPYRRELLEKLHLDFISISPNIDESPLENESANALVARLAVEKAKAIAKDNPTALIIASDQVAVLGDDAGKHASTILTKPHTHERAVEQLTTTSGKQVTFLTSLCLLNSSNEQYQLEVVPFTVKFLPLSQEQIENYLKMEKPYDCAGSFKSEGLGITLFEKMEGEDPNSLIGLPLIKLTTMLRNEGLDPLS
ncbi:MAG: Maf family protein [Cellvibrionaceae bacterium]